MTAAVTARRPGAALPPTAALRYCEEVTRRAARNFWYGIRLLPPHKRRAAAAFYAVARRIDDIGDGELDPAGKRAALDQLAAALATAMPSASDPVLAGLAQAGAACCLPLDALDSLMEGVRMDLRGAHYETIDDLVPYCRCVAGSIGRMALAVFMMGEGEVTEGAQAMADDLGVALQLTNILRDVREDREMGRVYLPAADLARFGLSADDLEAPPPGPAAALVRYEAGRAQAWFDRGLRLLPLLDRRSAACCGAMAGIYYRLLRQMDRRPEDVFVRRVTLPPQQKAAVALRALAGRPPGT